MKLTSYKWWRPGKLGTLCWIMAGLLGMTLARMTDAQGVGTTTVQGTVYLANGQTAAGTLVVSWPAFTTATGQAIAADSLTLTIPSDGFVSVNLTPNVGAFPAGEYYTAVFYMSDGSASTQYWEVPNTAQATLAQVETQVMPAAQAVQAVSKAYVDRSIAELTQSLLTASGGTLSGPLILNADPTQALQAATKHYVDTQQSADVPLAGGNMTGALGTPAVNGVQAPAAGSAQTTLQQAINAAGANGAMEIPPTYTGTDTFTNLNGVKVTDLRTSGAQQTERSVKEFGAVCDGVTDDTNALQAALNYAETHGVALTIPQGTCKTHSLNWRGESIGGMGKQVSALMGFPRQDVLASMPDSPNLLQNTRLHDLTIYVDQSVDVSCSAAEGRAAAGSCQVSRMLEKDSVFSPGGNGLAGTTGTGAAWAVGNCAIAMPAATGLGGNGLRMADIENLEIAATGVDPMAAQYPGAHSTHTCGMYLAQWPQWSEFRNIDIRGFNTGVAIPALPVTTPADLNADSNRWQNVTIQATHVFTAAAGSNNVLDNVVAMAGNSSATGEPPTGLVLDFAGTQQGWTVRNTVVVPTWTAVPPALAVTAAGGAVTGVTLGTEHGLGWDPYGSSVPLAFSGSCTAQATATVDRNGAIASVNVTQGGVGCSSMTTATLNAAGTWDTAAPVNLISGQEMTLFGGNLLKGNGGYTVWNAAGSASYGTQLDGGGGTLPGGGAYAALVGSQPLGTSFQVDQFPGADIGAKLQACLGAVNASFGGTCDARNFSGNLSMSSNLTISTGNTTILLPCATISTANQMIVTAGTRNVALRGCALRGGSAASGSQGGTAFAYSGSAAMVQVGDPTYAMNTLGFHMDNVVINTTGTSSASATGLIAYRTQEMDLESLYLLGNENQTGITLDGTGNYTGGTFLDDQIAGFQTAVNAIGHKVANPATTDWMNASTFVRLHINCPTANGNPISGTYGINLQQGDGNTFTGGDVEGCATALHLGANAQNNTIIGLRNENSTSQVVADTGSSYNSWMTGGTMFTGQMIDNGTRNSFLDSFHRSFNGLNGDWYGSQQDATVTNHYRLGIGNGNERGLLNEVQTDYGYRWLEGYSDATSGEQLYQVEDLLNNVNRLSIGQYNHGQSSTNNQTVVNSAGTGAVVLNGSNNAGTGGVVVGSGGTSAATVATISNAGNAQFNGTLQVGSTAQSAGTMTVRNSADAEVDYYLWPGLTASQKGSFTYKDWNGNSQWYLVKDQSNNWAVNSAVGALDSFKAYQSTNSGDTYVNASNSTGHIRLNYENGSGAETDIYSGSSSNLDAAFLSPTSIKLPGLAAGSGHSCLQIDNSGYITNTGSACGTGSGGGSGTVGSGNTGQIAYYTNNGTVVGGMNAVPLTAGGTGSTSAAGARANLGALSSTGGTLTGGLGGTSATFSGTVAAGTMIPATSPYADLTSPVYGTAKCDGAINVVGGVDENVAAFNLITAIWGTNGYTISSPAASTCVFTEPLNYSATTTSVTGKPISIDLHGGTWEFQVPSTVVARIAVTSGGQGYTVCPTGITLNGVSVASTVTCSLSTYATVSSVTLTNPYSGTAYSTPPTVAFVGGTFTTAATAIALMSGDLNITITTPDPLNPPTPNNADIPALRVVNGTLQDDGDGASVLFNLDGGQGTHNFLSNIDINNVYFRTAHCQTTAFQTSASFQGVIENSYAFEGDSPTGITSACYGYSGFSIQPGVPGVGTAEWMLKNLVVQGWDHGIYVSPFVGAQVNTDNNIVDETLEEGIYLGHAATSVGDHAEDSWYQNNQLANGTVQSNRGEIYVAAGSIATGSTGMLHTSNSDANAVVVTTSSSSTNSFVPSIGGAYAESGNNIISFAYSSGSPTISGTTSQTCTVTFPGIISPAQDEIGTIALTGTNTISTGSATAITRYGLAWTTGVATTGTLTNGTATCSGTATFSVVAYDTARVTGTGSAYVSGIPFNKSGTQTVYAPSATINPIPAGSVSNTALAHSSATVNGVNCALGSTCTVPSIGSAAVPPWLQYVGAGSEGAKNCSGNLNGDHHFTTFTVDSGNTCTVNSPAGLTIHATGACTINGTIYAGAINTNATSFTPPIGTAGGGGGGTNAGTAALSNALYPLASSAAGGQVPGGTGGTIGGGAGGAGNQPPSVSNLWKGLLSAGTDDGLYWSGGPGGAGSGATAGGAGGGSVVLICGSIVGSGTINTSGAAGSDASANNAGGGGGGAAGPIVLSSLQFAAPYSITLTQTGGAGGGCAAHTGCGVGGAGVAGLNAEF